MCQNVYVRSFFTRVSWKKLLCVGECTADHNLERRTNFFSGLQRLGVPHAAPDDIIFPSGHWYGLISSHFDMVSSPAGVFTRHRTQWQVVTFYVFDTVWCRQSDCRQFHARLSLPQLSTLPTTTTTATAMQGQCSKFELSQWFQSEGM